MQTRNTNISKLSGSVRQKTNQSKLSSCASVSLLDGRPEKARPMVVSPIIKLYEKDASKKQSIQR